MKVLVLVFTLLIVQFSFGQAEKFKNLEPDLWLGIYDQENSDTLLGIDTLSYDDIPKYLDFRGTAVEVLQWEDSLGVNLLVQTVTGQFNWKDYEEDSNDFTVQDKSEIYAYLFRKNNGETQFTKVWRVYDFNPCFGVDWYTGFIPKSLTITDLNKDGISEITMAYVLICRGGMDPGRMKIIMYEGNVKYALRGSTMIYCEASHPYGGEFNPSTNLVNEKDKFEFLKFCWDLHKCERRRFY